MKNNTTAILTLIVGGVVLAGSALAAPTVRPSGVTINEPGVFEGYVLFNGADGVMHMIDIEGNLVRDWPVPGNSRGPARPLAPGHVLTKSGNAIMELAWDGTVVWQFSPSAGVNFHHDSERLENGNTLILARETINDPTISVNDILDDFFLEVDPSGTVVWEWHVSDHINEFDWSQERLDWIYNEGGDITHGNAVSPIPQNTSHTDPRFRPGNVVFSARTPNTVAIIDRQTDQVVWSLTDVVIGQHNTHMLPNDLPGAGNILVFDNAIVGTSFVPIKYYSRIVEIDPVSETLPYIYTAEDSGLPKHTFFSDFGSGMQRLPNGNTIIATTMFGRVFEVTSTGELVWEYISPFLNQDGFNLVYRAYKVPLEWAGPFLTPDLVVTGSAGPDPVQGGQDLTYAFQVENTGTQDAVTVELSQPTPAGATYQSVSAPSWSCAEPAVGSTGSVTCTRSVLTPGSSSPVNFVFRVDLCDAEGQTISGTATATSLGVEANPGDNAKTVDATGAANTTLVQDLLGDRANSGQDVQLNWGDQAPECGYRVLRSTAPNAGFVDISGAIPGNSYTDIGAAADADDYYYLIEVD